MTNFIDIGPVEIWLVLGVICILIEFSAISGIGFLFAGFGALTNAILIYNFPESKDYQIISFGILSLLWFLLLWWPLKIYVYGRGNNKNLQNYFDIVGSSVKVVGQPLTPDVPGQVEWSGTILNARLANEEKSSAEIGDVLYVQRVQGNLLICSKTKN